MIGWFMVVACMRPEGSSTGPTSPLPDRPDPTFVETGAHTGSGFGATTGDTASFATGDTAPGEVPFDCSAPWPSQPLGMTTLTGWTTAEDFDFDAEGYLVSVNNRNLVGKDQYGNTKVISPGLTNVAAGTRVLGTGDWVVADVQAGALILVTTASGGQTTLLSGIAYPNGLDVDADHNVYIGENGGDRVLRVNAYDTTDFEVVARNIDEPNGVILSPDGQTLYVGSFGGGKIYAVDRDPAGGWLPHRVLYDPVGGDGGFDGINVDACGNVYITEFIKGNVYRISPDASQLAVVADLPSSWIPNLRWGVGVGGWDPDTLYVADRDQGRIFAIDVGIPGKKHILAP